jgi:LacI family transcriptional regulator
MAPNRRRRRNVLFLPCYRDERLLDGVCHFAYEAGWILNSLYHFVDELPADWTGDGILCMLDTPGRNPSLTDFVARHRNIPIVELSINDPSLDVPRVLQDNHQIGRMGAEHLMSIGCEELGFVIHDINHFHSERLEGFRQRGAESGLRVRVITIPYGFVSSPIDKAWFLKQIPNVRPYGVMVAADYLAQWMLDACDKTGISVPEEVALVGVDNTRQICGLSSIALSSIDNNAYQQGYRAAECLDKLMAGRAARAREIRIAPGALHVRQSSTIFANSHPHVATALRYIAKSFHDPQLDAQKVAQQVPMSERRLHDAFVKYVKRSVYQEILGRRLSHAKALIIGTERKLWDIAEVSGFGSPEIMSRIFRRKTGHPPSYFRCL